MALEDLSRDELEGEARRRGVQDVESLSRAELLLALLGRKRPSPLRSARDLFSKVVDKVREAVPGLPGTSRPPPATMAHRDTERPRLEEPILTRTMAGILAAQGHDDRALTIYEHLTQLHPSDAELAAEAGRVRERVQARGEHRGQPVVAVRVKPHQVLVSWNVTAEAFARARKVLEADGATSARIVVVQRDERLVIETKERTRSPVEAKGEWIVEVPEGARVTAAVGLLDGDRFVSAAHSPVA